MTEKRRTASEIRAYCEAATGGEDGFQYEVELGPETVAQIFELSEPNARFYANARTDMPRLLDAAVKLRRELRAAADVAKDEVGWDGADKLLAETAWLAEPSPEAASPEGESGEGMGTCSH